MCTIHIFPHLNNSFHIICFVVCIHTSMRCAESWVLLWVFTFLVLLAALKPLIFFMLGYLSPWLVLCAKKQTILRL